MSFDEKRSWFVSGVMVLLPRCPWAHEQSDCGGVRLASASRYLPRLKTNKISEDVEISSTKGHITLGALAATTAHTTPTTPKPKASLRCWVNSTHGCTVPGISP